MKLTENIFKYYAIIAQLNYTRIKTMGQSTFLIINNNINYYQYPSRLSDLVADDNAQINIGDLHANAMKFLYHLVLHKVVTLSPENYMRLAQLYQKPVASITTGDLGEFKSILSGLEVTSNNATVRLIGDELCDRGQNDYYILLILLKLVKSNLNLEILLSNHSIEFNLIMEKFKRLNIKSFADLKDVYLKYKDAPRRYPFHPILITREQGNSYDNLLFLLTKGLVTAEEIANLYDECYLPYLKPISYTMSQDYKYLTIYTHAECHYVANELLTSLAQLFEVVPELETIPGIARTIDTISQKFSSVANANQLNQYINLMKCYVDINLSGVKTSAPLLFVMWNRNTANKRLKPSVSEHIINYIDWMHGHDTQDFNIGHYGNIYNLNNDLGKQLDWNTSLIYDAFHWYFIAYSHQLVSKQLQDYLQSDESKTQTLSDELLIDEKKELETQSKTPSSNASSLLSVDNNLAHFESKTFASTSLFSEGSKFTTYTNSELLISTGFLSMGNHFSKEVNSSEPKLTTESEQTTDTKSTTDSNSTVVKKPTIDRNLKA